MTYHVKLLLGLIATAILLAAAVLFTVGCGGRSATTPVPPQPPPPVALAQCPPDALARFPLAKAYVDARGRLFCYDDTEAQADPSLLPLRWDKAGDQIKAIRPDVDLNNPYPLNSVVFKFMPHDGIDNGLPYWKLSRVPGYENDARAQTLAMYGLTTVDTWPMVIYALAEGVEGYSEPLSVVRHESLHLRWFGFFPDERCEGSTYAKVYEWTEHGTTCDVFIK